MTERLPDTISILEVAERLDCSDETVRRAIKRECADGVRDALRFISGGRVFNSRHHANY